MAGRPVSEGDAFVTQPWQGSARPLSPLAFEDAARTLGCDTAAIRAIWEVEAGGRHFLPDGSLVRRFEPHHMPRAAWGAISFAPAAQEAAWRASLRIGTAGREAMLGKAFAMDADAALRAASWGAPQIMGFNCAEAGYDSAAAMVTAMAESADAQLAAFVALVRSWGLDAAVRGHDWTTFARRYNGSGQVGEYARRMEAAYRRHSGGARSPQVLRVGDRGLAVQRLQEALAIEADGAFGPQTLQAVESFQRAAGLPVDGIAGQRTWAALGTSGSAQPVVQDTPADAALDRVREFTAAAGAIAAALAAVRASVPQEAFGLLLAGALGLAAIATTAWAVRWVRS